MDTQEDHPVSPLEEAIEAQVSQPLEKLVPLLITLELLSILERENADSGIVERFQQLAGEFEDGSGITANMFKLFQQTDDELESGSGLIANTSELFQQIACKLFEVALVHDSLERHEVEDIIESILKRHEVPSVKDVLEQIMTEFDHLCFQMMRGEPVTSIKYEDFPDNPVYELTEDTAERTRQALLDHPGIIEERIRRVSTEK